MTQLHSTIKAFPRGRSTEELLVLSGAAFDSDRRLAILAELDELDELLREGRVIKGRDGKWRPVASWAVERKGAGKPAQGNSTTDTEHLIAAPARFRACSRCLMLR